MTTREGLGKLWETANKMPETIPEQTQYSYGFIDEKLKEIERRPGGTLSMK